MKRIYCAMFMVFLFAEILIAKCADPAGFVRGSIGDVLVIPAIYCLIRVFGNPIPKLMPLAVFLMGVCAELLQLADVCGILGIRRGSLLGVLIGSSPDFYDIICYFVGTVIVYAGCVIEWKGVRKNER